MDDKKSVCPLLFVWPTQGLNGQPVDIHEVQPVKFGGSPTDPANKVILDRTLHRQQVTPWWNQFQRNLDGGG